MSNNKKEKHHWGDIGIKLFTTVIAGVLMAWAGYVSNYTLSSVSSKKESARLITELQIRREQAETNLRKDVFDQTLQAFLLKDKDQQSSIKGMSKQLLRLELLALNFGDSLSLSPLFTEFYRDQKLLKIEDEDENSIFRDDSLFRSEKGELRKRLYALARRVANTQVSSLEKHGISKTISIPLVDYDSEMTCNDLILYKEHFPWPEREAQRQFSIYDENYKKDMTDEEIENLFKLDDNNSSVSEVFDYRKNQFKKEEKDARTLYLETLNGQRKMVLQDSIRYLEVNVSNVNHCKKTLKVEFTIHKQPANILAEKEEILPVTSLASLTTIANENLEKEIKRDFTLDYFNFPIVDNTRLENNHRFAIVLDDFDLKSDKPHIELTALIFPSEYASLRDRPGMKEARELLKSALEDDADN